MAAVDRVLSTVLFSDIVGSTEQASSLGDQRWRELCSISTTCSCVVRSRGFGGRLVKSTGDGVLACFDGPGRGVRCGQRFHQTLAPVGIDVRVGLHTGEIEPAATTSVASACTSRLAFPGWLRRARSWCRGRSPTSSWAPGSSSTTAANTT